MRKHLIQFGIFIAAGAVALLPSVAGAMIYRQAPTFHVAPAPHFMPRLQAPRVLFQAPRAMPPVLHHYTVAPHAMWSPRQMVHGRYGWHALRNRSAFAVIPGLVSGEFPVDTETFLASIDIASPFEPVAGCSTTPCLWGAMSMANDGTWGTAWSYSNADAARAAALGNCASRASENCAGISLAVGTAWIAGLHCQKYDASGTYLHWSVMALGNDLGAAIRNAYRTIAMNGFFNVNECDFVSGVAADGTQTQFVAQE